MASDATPGISARATERILLNEALHVQSTLSREDRLEIVKQAMATLELAYIHLPQKRAMYAIDPVQRLRLLRSHIEQATDAQLPDAISFHKEMIDIFTRLRDLHTNYLLPAPFNNKTAFLPFLVEEYFEDGNSHFIVTNLDPETEHDAGFQKGVEVLYWNGVPIKRAVELNGDNQAGSNPDARYQRGLTTLTIRPLLRSLPPDEEWVTVRYRTLKGEIRDAEYKWYVSVQPPDLTVDRQAQGTGEALAFGFDVQWAQTQEVRKELYAPQAARQMEAMPHAARQEQVAQAGANQYESTLPWLFRAREQPTTSGTFGYLRIFSFMHALADEFVAEFKRLIEQLPQNGLIIDVRGNGGGNILASERSLQLLTSEPIEPARFQFINSPLTLALCQRYADLQVWRKSIAQSVETGALESLGFPITPKESFAQIQRAYQGPVVLITDALCYSATDIFAAGFQDHCIGKILGTCGNTGAGGANVWTHSDLCSLVSRLGDDNPMRNEFRPLPQGAGMRVAIRRCLRVRENAGIPVEDLGIVPDAQHCLTWRDLMEKNADLLEAAGRILRGA